MEIQNAVSSWGQATADRVGVADQKNSVEICDKIIFFSDGENSLETIGVWFRACKN